MDCIHSIIKHSVGISYEIIVVDNNSHDDFDKHIKSIYGNQVLCLPLSENIGFGRANNEGVKLARGRNIFFLNPDTLLLNNAVKILSDYLDANPSVACCGGNLYNVEMKPMHSYSMLLPSLSWEINLLSGGRYEKLRWGKNAQFNHTLVPRKVGYICGADMMVKHEVLEKLGGFSNDFFLYYEDTELAYRIKLAGYEIVSIPFAKIQHLEGKSMGGKSFNPVRIQYIETSLSKFYCLHTIRVKRKLICQLRLLRLNLKYYYLYKDKMDRQLYRVCRKIIFTTQL